MKLSERIREWRDRSPGWALIDVWADEVAQLEAENERLQTTLTLIGDIAFDSDGYAGNAEKLGDLVGEIYSYARNPQLAVDALKETNDE